MSKSNKSISLNSQPATLDAIAIAAQVNDDYSLGQELLAQGQTLYSPAPEGGGVLIATYPNGTTARGRLIKGQFDTLN